MFLRPDRAFSVLFVCLGVLLGAACGGSSADAPPRASGELRAGSPPAATPAKPERVRDTPRIIVLGDSLTAGLGLDPVLSFPSLLQERLDNEGYQYEVVNAGVSGDTSAGGLRRLNWALEEGVPQILIVALGGNDGLRGLPPTELEKNLAQIIEAGISRGLTVILAGMEAPPNYGAAYTSEFRDVYPTLARRYKLRLIPFLLEGVAGDRSLNQPDGIHPNARGARMVADLVWRELEPALTPGRPGAASPAAPPAARTR